MIREPTPYAQRIQHTRTTNSKYTDLIQVFILTFFVPIPFDLIQAFMLTSIVVGNAQREMLHQITLDMIFPYSSSTTICTVSCSSELDIFFTSPQLFVVYDYL